jgi:hypothetical protein
LHQAFTAESKDKTTGQTWEYVAESRGISTQGHEQIAICDSMARGEVHAGRIIADIRCFVQSNRRLGGESESYARRQVSPFVFRVVVVVVVVCKQHRIMSSEDTTTSVEQTGDTTTTVTTTTSIDENGNKRQVITTVGVASPADFIAKNLSDSRIADKRWR